MQNNVYAAVLGAAITAIVTLAALFIRHKLDIKSEERQHTRDAQLRAADQEHELATLKLQFSASEKQRLVEELRHIGAQYLGATQKIYVQITSIRRDRDPNSTGLYAARLQAISPEQGQLILDEFRLLASSAACESADRLWEHLRGDMLALRDNQAGKAWVEWKLEYWTRRAGLIEKIREGTI